MPIYRLFAGLMFVLAMPFLVVAGFFATCHDCEIPQSIILTILGLAFGAPVIFAVAAIAAVLAGALGLWRGLLTARPFSAAIGAVILASGVLFGLSVLRLWVINPSSRAGQNSAVIILKKYQGRAVPIGGLRRLMDSSIFRNRKSSRSALGRE